MAHHGVARPSAVGNRLPMAQVLDAQRLHHHRFQIGVHLVPDQAVYVVG